MQAEQIIKERKLIELASQGKHDEVIGVLKEYPEQRGEILAAMLMMTLRSGGPDVEGGNVHHARREMLGTIDEIVKMLDAFEQAFEIMGISPMINDMRSYDDVSAEVNETMVIEDFEAGLKLYNACSAFCRTYNAHNIASEVLGDKSKQN